jgi:hypothetical protein
MHGRGRSVSPEEKYPDFIPLNRSNSVSSTATTEIYNPSDEWLGLFADILAEKLSNQDDVDGGFLLNGCRYDPDAEGLIAEIHQNFFVRDLQSELLAVINQEDAFYDQRAELCLFLRDIENSIERINMSGILSERQKKVVVGILKEKIDSINNALYEIYQQILVLCGMRDSLNDLMKLQEIVQDCVYTVGSYPMDVPVLEFPTPTQDDVNYHADDESDDAPEEEPMQLVDVDETDEVNCDYEAIPSPVASRASFAPSSSRLFTSPLLKEAVTPEPVESIRHLFS